MEESVNALWAKTKDILKRDIPGPSYDAWFRDLQLVRAENGTMDLETADTFHANMISQRYLDMLEGIVQITFQQKYEIKVYARGMAPRPTQEMSLTLDPRYTFDTFIVGQSNRFAHAACVAVAELPAQAYNPLFIYGGVGLGKTHLMHATGHFILKNNPGAKLLYITSETFTNELIAAIRQNTNEQLRGKLRSVDVLLIDDIQFIAGKESTQEEFFHTFNHLRDNGKQIIISSDRPPKDIPTLEERLRSRFEWGLIADIQKPDYETRLAILTKKAETEQIDISHDVLDLIASHVDSNIRELEGTLNRLIAMAQLSHEPITLSMAEDALQVINKARDPRAITPDLIASMVCEYMGVSREDLLGKKRNREIALVRQYAIYICREMTNLSTTRIGAEFGGRDHSTVMHACDKVSELMDSDTDTRRTISAIRQKISSR